jgi:Spy/CpxP family protein refolding chaperone
MKASLLVVALLWAAAAGAQTADTPSGPPARESPAQRMDHLATLLDLTDAQKPQVEAVLKAEHEKMRAQHEAAQSSGQQPSSEQMKSAHEQLQQETLAKLTPILSAAQLKKFQIIMEHEHGGPAGHRGPPPQGQ